MHFILGFPIWIYSVLSPILQCWCICSTHRCLALTPITCSNEVGTFSAAILKQKSARTSYARTEDDSVLFFMPLYITIYTLHWIAVILRHRLLLPIYTLVMRHSDVPLVCGEQVTGCTLHTSGMSAGAVGDSLGFPYLPSFLSILPEHRWTGGQSNLVGFHASDGLFHEGKLHADRAEAVTWGQHVIQMGGQLVLDKDKQHLLTAPLPFIVIPVHSYTHCSIGWSIQYILDHRNSAGIGQHSWTG